MFLKAFSRRLFLEIECITLAHCLFDLSYQMKTDKIYFFTSFYFHDCVLKPKILKPCPFNTSHCKIYFCHISKKICLYSQQVMCDVWFRVICWNSTLNCASLGFSKLKWRQWATCQIHTIAGCACAGNAGNVFPTTEFKGSRWLVLHSFQSQFVIKLHFQYGRLRPFWILASHKFRRHFREGHGD